MAKMAVTLPASDLGSKHSVADILILFNFSLFELIIECRPSTSAIVFGLRSEKRLSADHTVVHSGAILLIKLVYMSVCIL
jgi:hypothetical protein